MATQIGSHYGSLVLTDADVALNAYAKSRKLFVSVDNHVKVSHYMAERVLQNQVLEQGGHKDPSNWFRRAQIHLKLRYPDLALKDAHTARLLFEKLEYVDSKAVRVQSASTVMFCTALLFTRSWLECSQWIDKVCVEHEITRECRGDLVYIRGLAVKAMESDKQRLCRDGASWDEIEETMECGKVFATSYPWENGGLSRTGKTLEKIKRDVKNLSYGSCEVRRSHVPDTLVSGCLGIYALHGLEAGDIVFKEGPCFLAWKCNSRNDGGDCEFCGAKNKTALSTAMLSGFCSTRCKKRFRNVYGEDFNLNKGDAMIERFVSDSDSHPDKVISAREKLRYRVLQSIARQLSRNRNLDALSSSPINQLVGYSAAPKSVAFSFGNDIELPIKMLKLLGIEATDLRFDQWILMTITGRINNNSWEQDNEDYCATGINAAYSLLNHSCVPNIQWSQDWTLGQIILTAKRDIKAGEELFISYLDEEELKLSTAHRQEKLLTWMPSGHYCKECQRTVGSSGNPIVQKSMKHAHSASSSAMRASTQSMDSEPVKLPGDFEESEYEAADDSEDAGDW